MTAEEVPDSPKGPPLLPMPMFPLGTVLFPYVRLPLHVFESRYRALVRDCLRNQKEFGVVLIERGSEVGGGDDRFGVGTVAQIIESAELPDGRWVLEAVGTRRIRIATWLPDDPYPLALAADAPDPDEAAVDPALLTDAERAVRRALALKAELAEPAARADTAIADEPAVAAWQLAAIAPLALMDHQRLLEQDGVNARLALLAELAGDAADVLAYRLSRG
jgi:Lon protease-like protein